MSPGTTNGNVVSGFEPKVSKLSRDRPVGQESTKRRADVNLGKKRTMQTASKKELRTQGGKVKVSWEEKDMKKKKKRVRKKEEGLTRWGETRFAKRSTKPQKSESAEVLPIHKVFHGRKKLAAKLEKKKKKNKRLFYNPPSETKEKNRRIETVRSD